MVVVQKRKIRWAISLLLVMLYFSGLTAQAQYDGGSGTTASAETNTYVFLLSQSAVVQTGGIAGVHWTYSVEGLFQLTVDPDAGTASFAYVDANATDDSPLRRTLDPNEVFNMTSLLGAVLNDTTISFTGKAADGSDVLITVTIEDDLAYLVGQTIPPPNTADFFLFSLDAVAQQKDDGGSGTTASVETSTYLFLSDQSTVVKTGGIAGVHETYPIEGQFQLTVDANAGVASFDYVDAFLLSPISSSPPQSLGELFNMAELQGTVVNDALIEFRGKTADNTNTDIALTLTFTDDAVQLTGQTIPPPNTADFFIFSVDAVAQRKYGGGTGEPNDPYLIYTAEQMNEIGLHLEEDWYKHFKLMADIDLGSFTGTSFNIIGIDWDNAFSGVFDGNGKIISNFSYTSTGTSYVGLFGYVRWPVEIIDLGLIAPNVDVGMGNHVGSLVGYNYGTVINCYTEGGSVSGNSQIGGLVGSNVGTISNSYASSSASGSSDYVGGLAGYNDGTIFSCASSGSVETDGNCVGGLTGFSNWIVSESYATGSVSGRDTVGGLIGWNRRTIASTPSGTIANCYAVGAVSGANDVGGLIGKSDGGGGGSSFWDTQTSGQPTSAGGTGKTTAEMQDPNTFLDAGWDFVDEYENGPNDDWGEPISGGYPVLWWQLTELPELPSFSGGSGQADDPYLISTPADLSRIGHNPRLMNAHFKLTNDVNMAGGTHFIIGNGSYPFAGTFDGGGHLISNFHRYSRTGEMSKGLFGIVDDVEAEIKNVGLTDSSISGGGYQTVGLLVGLLRNGTVSGCFAERGRIEVFESDVGGLVGANEGTISNCYANVSVSGWFGVGGLVERNNGSISNSYSRGRVDGHLDFGGLVSRNLGTVTNSFWDIETSGQETSDGGTGKTTAEMQMASTFTDAGWDFVGESVNGTEDIWSICEGTNYPRLVWQIPAGDFVCPDGITIDDFEFFTEHWLDDNCDISNDYCQGTDLDFSGTVDEADLEIFAENWLAGVRSD